MTNRSMTDLFSMKDRVAIVTGGGTHLGSAFTEALSELGAQVYIASRRAELCEETAAAMRTRSLNVTALACDVTDEESVNSLVDQVMEREGRLDVFVANAGGSNTTAHPPHADVDEFRWTLEKNLTSTYMCAQAAGRVMIAQKSGSIIALGSIASRLASDPRIYNETFKRSGAPYVAAKAGTLALTKALAAEYSPHGVRVNCICPGQIPNDLTDKVQAEKFRTMNAFHRTGLAEDIKGACALLASDAGKWITGTDILVDGGWSIW
jgi:NAD(P)-dependent dehydrogenase (short-subunit alcohol dehydrogenase family)|uniref:SDR family NAD(P)-dependent oxidoreductase n=1 Tax=Candidatus Planktophila sp. TaxID=2175601 RepID=UPI00404AAD10